ncbi:hypothetical protein ABC345_18215 [Shouchella sp. 1P09AA]|uniref:hypothetical protein n=1 Tax=unclassified Shouchella TaxID=2893065 RepID=UPI0039A3DDE2
MFSPTDWIRLFMSALLILPIVTVIRESGYYLAVTLLKGENKNLIIGSGPTLFKIPTIEVRRYFFMFSWMEYDGVKPSNRTWHGIIYAAPILTTAIFAFVANALVLEGVLPANIFWSTFIFYCFYYMLFDVIPVYLPDGQPTNGRAIFDLMWHGERSDYKKQRLEREAKEEEQHEEEERSRTEAQEETMENRDRDDQERGDHTTPETEESDDTKRSYTEAQEETKENRDRDEKERGDHTDPES